MAGRDDDRDDFEQRSDGADLTRRGLLRGAASAAALGATATSAFAQDRWWQDIFSNEQGAPQGPGAGRAPRKAPPLDDLRPGNIPWRSDEMLLSMDRAIERYVEVSERGDWPTVERGRLLRVGGYDERVVDLRRRLYLGGELSRDAYRATRRSIEYDRDLERAVKQFQKSHGLRVNGFINTSTRAQLNVSARERFGQLKLNRQRIAKLLQGRIEDRYILVNSAAYQLEAVERFEVRRRHRVIVGKPDRQTPDIQATIKGLNFFPYWRVPKSIAVKDVVPRLLKEPDYLEKEHIIPRLRAYNGDPLDPSAIDWSTFDPEQIKFRQEPGPWNALGLVRVNMPNKDIVYLHDTPMKPLFKQAQRAFSAGCVRVQDVMDLAAWIARYEQGFERPEPAVQAILDGGQPVDVELSRPVPVYFTYLTAWAEADGSIEFRPDIYGRDGAESLRGERDEDDLAPGFMLSP